MIQCGSYSPEIASTIPPLSAGICFSSHWEVDLIFPLNLAWPHDSFYQFNVVEVTFWDFPILCLKKVVSLYFLPLRTFPLGMLWESSCHAGRYPRYMENPHGGELRLSNWELSSANSPGQCPAMWMSHLGCSSPITPSDVCSPNQKLHVSKAVACWM